MSDKPKSKPKPPPPEPTKPNEEEFEYDSDDSIDLDELHKMLDNDLGNKVTSSEQHELLIEPSEEKVRHFLIEKGKNHFEVLPQGWIKTYHNSGIPVYLHRPTRVVTASRPYFIGPGSIRVSPSFITFWYSG